MNSGGWAQPRDNFAPVASDYRTQAFDRHSVARRSPGTDPDAVGALSTFADSSTSFGNVSSRKSFTRPVPPPFAEREGPIHHDEAVAMFKSMDLNTDGVITHAELMRAMHYNDAIPRRLEKTGDIVHMNLARRVVSRELKLPEGDTFTLQEWVNFCETASQRQGKARRFIVAYQLDVEQRGSAAGTNMLSAAISAHSTSNTHNLACPSISETRRGGSGLRPQQVSEYESLLELRTASRRRNTTTR